MTRERGVGAVQPEFVRWQYCRRILSLSGIALIVATWWLWFPDGRFPQIPFLESAVGRATTWDWTLSAVLLAALGRVARANDGTREKSAVAAACLALVALFVLNQHRFQPWAWFLLLGLIATSASPTDAMRSLRWLIASVYIYSGLSKLEPMFLSGGGTWLLDGLLQTASTTAEALSPRLRSVLLFCMPAGEITAGLCVLIPRLRQVGLGLCVIMHLTLLLALGPLGLGHKPGVLIWNLTFLLLAFPLLLPVADTGERSVLGRAAGSRAVALIMICAMVLPVFGQRGGAWVDQWPAWSLYSSWPERVRVYVHEEERDKLPEAVAVHTLDPQPLDWCLLRLDRWSLDAVAAPIYPQNRFRVAAAAALFESAGITNYRIVAESAADSDGERTEATISTPRELTAYLDQFQLNTRPRARGQ